MSLNLVMDSDKIVQPVFSEAAYTIRLEGGNIVARDADGNVAATNSDFGAAWNTLDANLSSWDSVFIKSGTYNTIATPTVSPSKSHITLIGESGTVLKKSIDNTNRLMTIYGSHNTLQNIAFDDSLVGGQTGCAVLSGSYNAFQSCSLRNCIRYGLSTLEADHFSILDCTVTRAQYGIAGLADINGVAFSTNGLVKGNTVSGCDQAGIKMKMWKNVLVTNNHVDIGNPNASPAEGCFGIWYYHYDCPTQDVTVSYNTIVDSVKESGRGIGIVVDPDDPREWINCPYLAYGMKILRNTVSVPFYNIIIKGDGCQIDYNDCSVGGMIDVRGNNNTLTRNLGRIRNSGSGNTIIDP